MKIKNLTLTLCTTLLLASFAGHAKEVKIGMAIDDLRLERWQKDRDIFVKKAESLVPKCLCNPLTATKKPRCHRLKI
ncbi:D-xylose-binding periplasmic protein [Enterobacter cancerogenus]|uniref:D-xylose-binding periplasmic protein n=1 Tax=Enterobacter cancerogenus TaxID=69218 RepID=A0A484XS94_9ENTR|nr:D-xylose-binding periplasmic protein [Enterobacter cancerogenus]